MLRLGYSPLTNKFFCGNANQKEGDTFITMKGKRTDVTQDFYNCLLEKFKPGYAYTIDSNGKPKYRITVEDLEKKKEAGND